MSDTALQFSNFPGNPGSQQIFPIVQASLFCHFFQVVNFIWQQTRGAGISSHISSSLSNLAFTIVDRSWVQVFKGVLDLPTFPFSAIRYVDNRYIFFPEEKVQEPSIQVIFELIFTFEQWPINSHGLDHLSFLHRLDEVHQECPTQHFRVFDFIYRPQALNSFFPHCTGIFLFFFCHICPVVNVIWMKCRVFLLTNQLPQPRPPGFPPPAGRSPPGVSNTALPF